MRRHTATLILGGLAALGTLLVAPVESTVMSSLRWARSAGVRSEAGPTERNVGRAHLPPVVLSQDPPPDAPGEAMLFAPELPRAPHRRRRWPANGYRAPIGGQLVLQTETALREGRCAEALDAVQQGMHEVSIDYAAFVPRAWSCFDDTNGQPLEEMEVRARVGMDCVAALLGDESSEAHPLPLWYRHASQGLEVRLERLTADDFLYEVLVDYLGEPQLADDVARDLQLEAHAAVAYANIPPWERDPRAIEQWARRVFVLEWAAHQRPGVLVRTHRRELVAVLDGLLTEATTPRRVGDQVWPVPELVLDAQRIARGG